MTEVWARKRIIVNTDPQRRCYDGVNFSERIEWTEWAHVADYSTPEDAQAAAATFQEINPGRQYQIR